MNKAIIFGNITKNIELKATQSGLKVASFGVATNRKWKDQQGQLQEEVEFHNVTAFGGQAETIAKYFGKGSKILVEGRLKTQNWEDKDCGKKMYRTEILLEKFEFGAKQNGVVGGQPQPQPQNQQNKKDDSPEIEYPDEDINPEDIPF